MKKICVAVMVVTCIVAFSGISFAQGQFGKKQIKLNPENTKKAAEIIKRNKDFFSNPQNLKMFTIMVNNMNKKKNEGLNTIKSNQNIKDDITIEAVFND